MAKLGVLVIVDKDWNWEGTIHLQKSGCSQPKTGSTVKQQIPESWLRLR